MLVEEKHDLQRSAAPLSPRFRAAEIDSPVEGNGFEPSIPRLAP